MFFNKKVMTAEKLSIKDLSGLKASVINPEIRYFLQRHSKAVESKELFSTDVLHIATCNIFMCYNDEFRSALFEEIFINSVGHKGIMVNDRNKSGNFKITDSKLYNGLIELKINMLGKYSDGYRQLEHNYFKAVDEHNKCFDISPWFSSTRNEADHFVLGPMLLIRHFILHDAGMPVPAAPPKKI